MRILDRGAWLIFGAIALSSCVSVSPEAERVRVFRNANQVGSCTSLGQIEARSGWGGWAADAGFENNKASLQNDAARLGADTVLVLQERGNFMPHTFAEAYRCSAVIK